LCRGAGRCNVGERNGTGDEPSYAAAVQSTTTSKEVTMTRSATHLYRRLMILGVTAALFATIVPEAFAELEAGESD
jgi:hypothetical protein